MCTHAIERSSRSPAVKIFKELSLLIASESPKNSWPEKGPVWTLHRCNTTCCAHNLPLCTTFCNVFHILAQAIRVSLCPTSQYMDDLPQKMVLSLFPVTAFSL
jgi:hypothetical protein